MKRYPAWQAIFRSFFSMDFYRDVAEHWGEVGFLYLFLLAGLYWVLITASFQVGWSAIINHDLIPLASQMPELKAVDGKFQIDKPSPYAIQVHGLSIVFDTTGQTQSLETSGFLVTDREVLSFGGTKPSQVLFKAQDMTTPITPALLRTWVEAFRNYFWIFLLAFGWFFGTLFLYLLDLVYAVIGLIFNAITQSGLKFSQLMRLAALAMTPPLLIESLTKLIVLFCNPSLNGPSMEMLLKVGGILLTLIYLFLGVNACKAINRAAQAAEPTVS